MAASSKDKDISRVVSDMKTWEDDLVTSKNGYIIVADIYTSWCGACKAVDQFFKKFFFEFGDKAIKFVKVEGEKIVKQAESAPPVKGGDADDDTTRAKWLPILQKAAGKSQPLFLFYKDGKLRYEVLGVNIPTMTRIFTEFQAELKAKEAEKQEEESEDS